MSLKPIVLKEGAILISDAHYSKKRPELLDFLKSIQKQKIKPSQLILMGDIFDALFGMIPRTYESNQAMIECINDLSLEIDLIYLEGNHDFNLASVFPKVQIFTIENQPVPFKKDEKTILLAHGDFVGTAFYKIYTKVIRSPFIVRMLNLINIILNNKILNNLNEYLDKKKDCVEIKNFEQIILKRLGDKFECDYLIEGHFHQNKSLELQFFKYINLAAFACNQRYFIVKSDREALLEEKIFSKEK